MSENKLHFETKLIHGGYHPDHTGSRGIAIYPTAAYHFKSCDHAARLFELSEAGNIYTRLQNPTTSAYEERMAALYNGTGALAVSPGMIRTITKIRMDRPTRTKKYATNRFSTDITFVFIAISSFSQLAVII